MPANESRKSEAIEELQSSLRSLQGDTLTIDQIVFALGYRSFGLVILMFSLPMVLPMPPGVPMTSGIIIGAIGLQLVTGRKNLWLPRPIGRRKIKRSILENTYLFAAKYLGWLFRLARPRLPQLTGSLARRIAGAIFVILAVVMVLPIPLIGNVIPALAAAILALGLADRDGWFYVIGVIIAVIAVTLSALLAGTLSKILLFSVRI